MSDDNMIKLWMPIVKSKNGGYKAILSDTSIDRDNEFMSKQLLNKWCGDINKYIPLLKDHKNLMDNLIGHWESPRVITGVNGEDHALTAIPKFYDGDPEAEKIKNKLNQGARIGVSIGAIPKASKMVKRFGEEYKMWTEAELVEASFTPIGSNRNSYVNIAKSYDLEKKPNPKKEEEEEAEEDETKKKPKKNNDKKKIKSDNMENEEVKTEVKEASLETKILEELKKINDRVDSIEKSKEEIKAPVEEKVDRRAELKALASTQVQKNVDINEKIIEKESFSLSDMLSISHTGKTYDMLK